MNQPIDDSPEVHAAIRRSLMWRTAGVSPALSVAVNDPRGVTADIGERSPAAAKELPLHA
jgi:hypothetical protein